MRNAILIIDDDHPFARDLAYHLRANSYRVDIAANRLKAIRVASLFWPDLTVIGVTGRPLVAVNLARRIFAAEEVSRSAFLFVVSNPATYIALAGASCDCVERRIGPAEVAQRVERFLQRLPTTPAPMEKSPGIHHGAFTLYPDSLELESDGILIHFAEVEFKLLRRLLESSGEVVTRLDLLKEVWDIDVDTGTRTLDAHVTRLRVKFAKAGISGVFETIRGIGVKFSP